ncbi:MAG: thioredoxin family protein [Bacteroidota bacterium]
MKYYSIFLFTVILPIWISAQENEKVQWLDLDEAIELQREEPRKLFIDVYTDWCGWCKKMDKTTFQDTAIIKMLNEEFYPVKFDAESDHPVRFAGKVYKNPDPGARRSTHQLTYALLGKKVSYPSYAFFDEKYSRITVVKGYVKPENLMPVLHYIGRGIYQNQEWKDFMTEWEKDTKQ